ncbi:nucleoporin Nup145p [Trichomonascus vanleenenianus]|uniref:nucleocytoplasmic transporter NUP145 n=1 Tax=Trichomonascus vanleenenianus TaxID=2268995 RepID=UPI003ECB1ED6
MFGAKTTSNSFSFGSSSANTGGSGISFGANANNPPGSTSGGFSFGSNAANTGAGSSVGLFGGNKPATGGFGTPSSGSGGFSFGSSSNTATNTGGGLFGGSGGSTGGLFGGNNPSTGGLFGTTSNANQPAQGSSGLLGNKPTTGTGGGLLGGSAGVTGTTNSGGLFGSNTGNTGTTGGGGLFGSSIASGPGSTGGGLFGNKPAATTGGGLFGSNTGSTGGGLFGSAGGGTGGGLFNKFGVSSGNTQNFLGGGNASSNLGVSQNSSLLSSSFAPNQSLIASIDQAPYSLASTPSLNRSLGPLTSSTRRKPKDGVAPQTPIQSKSSRASLFNRSASLKAAPSPRTALNSARASPYAFGRKEVQRTRSMMFNQTESKTVNVGDVVLKHKHSIDQLIPTRRYDNYLNDGKRLVINRKGQRSLESITGRSPPERRPPRALNPHPLTSSESFLDSTPDRTTSTARHSKTFSVDTTASSVPLSPGMKQPEMVVTPSAKFSKPEPRGKVYEINQIAKDNGYWISPQLHTLYTFSRDQLAAVPNLTIGRKGYGQIAFNQPVDLTKIDNLSDILGNIVIFGQGTVCVYPDLANKAPRGYELNLPATVSLENCYATDKKTREKIVEPGDSRLIKHIDRLKRAVESRGGEFVAYDVNAGLWTFKVPHFSTWGLVDDDYSDEEFDDGLVTQTIKHAEDYNEFVNGNKAPEFNMSEFANEMNQNTATKEQPVFSFGHNQFGSIGTNNLFGKTDPYVQHDHQKEVNENDTLENLGLSSTEPTFGNSMPEDTFGDKIEAIKNRQRANGDPQDQDTRMWGIEDGDFSYSSDEESATEQPPRNGAMVLKHKDSDILDGLLEREFDGLREGSITSRDIYPRETSKDWLKQLDLSGKLDSPLANIKSKDARQIKARLEESKEDEERGFTAADLDAALFSGTKALDKTASLQYKQAAAALRLPDMFSPCSFARFSPGTGRLISKSSSSPSGIKLVDTSVVEEAPYSFADQVRLTRIVQRENSGLPLSSPSDSLTFKYFASRSKEHHADKYEKSMWELASILFDPISLLGLEEIPYEYSDVAQEKIKEKHRRRLLSRWLAEEVNASLLADLEKATDSLDRIYIYLTGHQIQRACEEAIKGNNFHLATVLPLAGTADKGVREDALKQLKQWSEMRVLGTIPTQIRQIYELLAGNTTISKVASVRGDIQVPELYMSEGLDWKRALGLKLWYEASNNDPISVAVEEYALAYRDGVNRIAQPVAVNAETNQSQLDLCYQLLRLYGSIDPSLVSVLQPIRNLDYRAPWSIYMVLVQSSKLLTDFGSVIGDELSVNYGCQLEAQGQWTEALFVLSHIVNDNIAKRYIEMVLSNHVEEIAAKPNVRQQLIDELRIPESLINQVQALRSRYDHDYLEECHSLLRGGFDEEAHRTLIGKVAPRAVIEDKVDRLRELLSRFTYPWPILGWSIGGQVYLDYVTLRSEPANGEVARRLLESLAEILNTDKFDTRVASNIMAQYVGKLVRSMPLKTGDGSRLLQMKMGENEYLQQTIDLSVNYFKNRLIQ